MSLRGSLSWGSLSGGLCPGESLCLGRVSVRETPTYGNVQAVRILLECILVRAKLCALILLCKKYGMCITLLELNSKLNLSDIKSKQ